MENTVWECRWLEGQIGFHREDYNPHLLKHWFELQQQEGDSVFLPLCGKTLDMMWLKQAGLSVYGAELVELAVNAFYQEHGLAPEITDCGVYKLWQDRGIHIIEGDFFTLPASIVNCTLFYDRAALIALPPALRKNYVQQLMKVAPKLEQGLLVSLEYEQTKAGGPPFSVEQEEVEQLFTPYFHISKLEASREPCRGVLKEQGVNEVIEVIYKLERK